MKGLITIILMSLVIVALLAMVIATILNVSLHELNHSLNDSPYAKLQQASGYSDSQGISHNTEHTPGYASVARW